ncbi:DUF2637 domain-containing protein [Streptomyces sp. IBSNAI002]|uniref:DUF2637 domain-containing protein n=1 Tax=Streptomyces sp. IBSNAI002 TaxID=3457500 RepID=UPI003FCFB164
MTAETTDKPQTASTRAIPALTRTHRILIGVVVAGAVVIAGIGFAGSYTAVRALAVKKGFGDFALVFPIGIDAGICVLLALDLLLTWIRIPFPMLRQTAWLLTVATIAFNGAAAWPDPLGVGMHAVIPMLFVVTVEAARHAVGRIADVTADRHMEGVRVSRWLLSPGPTFLLWRRMKLWELRSYEQTIKLEQDRYVYRTWLESEFGKKWKKVAPVELLMPLRLARFGKPLSETVPAVLVATGREVPALFQPQQMKELPPAAEQGADLEAAEAEPQPQPQALESATAEPAAIETAPEPEVLQDQELPSEQDYQDVRQFAEQRQQFPGEQYAVPTDVVGPTTQVPADRPVDVQHSGGWMPAPYEQTALAQPYGPEHVYGDPVIAPYEQTAAAPEPAPFVEPEPVAYLEPEPVVYEETLLPEIPQQHPEPAAPARSAGPARVQAKVEDLGEEEQQPVRAGRGAKTRTIVEAMYRTLPDHLRAERGRPLARAIVEAAEANGHDLKFDTVKRTHITEELIAQYEQGLGSNIPAPRDEDSSQGDQ